MLSHMSLDYCINYLRDCEAEKSAKTITLCHLSERNSDAKLFRDTVAGAFGVPTFVAQKGTIVELNKDNV
jgi:ribonuclease BN (tRNA processing enzyme)